MFWSGPKIPRNSSEHVRKDQETNEKAPLACREQVKQGPEEKHAWIQRHQGHKAQEHSGNRGTSILAHKFSLPKTEYNKGRRKSKQGYWTKRMCIQFKKPFLSSLCYCAVWWASMQETWGEKHLIGEDKYGVQGKVENYPRLQ